MALRRCRAGRRAALLASTAIIALLTGCQATGNGSGSAASGNSQHEYWYGPPWAW
jgi:hypothetical protein